MKILHLPYNPAGQMSSQAQALIKAGINTSYCTYGSNIFNYPTDIKSPIANIPGTQRAKAMTEFAQESIKRFDIFHFHGGLTFSNSYEYTDLPLLVGKKLVMNFWGSEVRKLSIAKRKNPYSRVKLTDEAAINNRLNKLSQYIETVIVPDYEIFEYVKDFFSNIHTVRYVVDHEKIKPVYPNPKNKKPLVIHAPSEPYLKGTEFVLKAVKNLKGKIDFEFKLIQNMPHAEAMKWYKKADIIVDQLCLGIYSIFSIESMLLGKPVIAYIREDLKDKYPPDLPIISANPNTIEKNLYSLLRNPQLRNQLGIKGRNYAIKHHAPEKIARQLISIYKKL